MRGRRFIARAIVAFVGCAAVSACPSLAHADSTDAAGAQALFDDGRKLMNAGDFAHACPKFAASQKKDPAAGTLLNLANCYEKNGQFASAWLTFKDAASSARTSHHADWEKTATARAAALDAKLVRLTVKLTPTVDGSDGGVTVKRDGFVIAAEEFGAAIPVDAGTHTIDATAPGKKPFHRTITIDNATGSSLSVVVPQLDAAKPGESDGTGGDATNGQNATTPSSASPSPFDDLTPIRIAGLAVAGAGVVSLAVGAITGVAAIGKNNDASAICATNGACSSMEAIHDADSAHGLGTASTVFFVSGVVLAGGGAALFFLGPDLTGANVSPSASASARVSIAPFPLIGGGATGVGVHGGF